MEIQNWVDKETSSCRATSKMEQSRNSTSIWEQSELLHSDCLIVGAGITGLSTAAALLEAHPRMRVRVLERGLLPRGASTRNAGFACLGSLSELAADLRAYGPEALRAALRLKYEGLQGLRQRLGDAAIGYVHGCGYELLLPQHLPDLEYVDALNALSEAAIGLSLLKLDRKEAFGFKNIAKIVSLPQEGALHTGKLISALMRYVRERGGEILTGCHVQGWEAYPGGIRLLTAESVDFFAPKVAFCTNAFTPELLPDVPLLPGRGQVLLTEAISGLPFRGTFHLDRGYFYFRDFEGGVLLGGGRHLDKKTETTTDFTTTAAIQSRLESLLREVILPDRPLPKIRSRWAGIMAFRTDHQLLPIVGHHTEGVYVAAGLNGMGVAAGTAVGQQLAALMMV